MELKDAILQRRSVRRYTDKAVTLDVIGEIIDVARFAPSAGNLQNWQFIVVTDKKKKAEITTACLEQTWMNQAPVHLIICNQYKKVTGLYGKLGKMFSIQDCAIIASYIQLLARERGLDTCWIGAFDNEAMQRILELPEDVDPEIILTLGYSAEKKVEEPKREDIDDLIFFDKWNKRTAKFPKSGVMEKVKGLLKK